MVLSNCSQVRKCLDAQCCPEAPLEDICWLPDPVLGEDAVHYKSFAEVDGSDTTDDDRGSVRFATRKVAEAQQVQ